MSLHQFYLWQIDTDKATYRDVPQARREARLEKARKQGRKDAAEDEDDEEDLEEREWPTNIARLGENTSICYWQFTK